MADEFDEFEDEEFTEAFLQAASEAEQLLPPASPEQRAVVAELQAGRCVVCDSVAGSGKTTTMLHVSLTMRESAVIVTYNRALSDSCNERIKQLGLKPLIKCYTYHGLVAKSAGRSCRNDTELLEIVTGWEKRSTSPQWRLPCSAVMLDEVQDLRPSYAKALKHILEDAESSSLLMLVVGDSDQLLYDFDSYGCDKATPIYLQRPEREFGPYTKGRSWSRLKLSISYRLTPHTAGIVNAIWGTSIIGQNFGSANQPVQYWCLYPYPPMHTWSNSEEHLHTRNLADIIKEFGPENVMFLAHSIKNEKCPLRVHMNQLSSEGFCFSVHEHERGFEFGIDHGNKTRCSYLLAPLHKTSLRRPHLSALRVRVGTFHSAKGCEADAVVVFGCDLRDPTSHICSTNAMGVALSRAKKQLYIVHAGGFENGRFEPFMYFPCGDGGGDYVAASGLTHSRIHACQIKGQLVGNPPSAVQGCPKPELVLHRPAVTEYNYFSADELNRFLSEYSIWNLEQPASTMIEYEGVIQFARTKEDVSAIYGEAVPLCMQFKRHGYCPKIENAIIGPVVFELQTQYSLHEFMAELEKKGCCMSQKDTKWVKKKFGRNKVRGRVLIDMVNKEVKVSRARRTPSDRSVEYRVRAMEGQVFDELIQEQLIEAKRIYTTGIMDESSWLYLANVCLALGGFHEVLRQVGISPSSYAEWADLGALAQGVAQLEGAVPDDGIYEKHIEYEFKPSIRGSYNREVDLLLGIPDWVGEGEQSDMVMEFKFVRELSSDHQLQTLLYAAMHAVNTGMACKGVLFNARTGERQSTTIQPDSAERLLRQVTQFKFGAVVESSQPRVTKCKVEAANEPCDRGRHSKKTRSIDTKPHTTLSNKRTKHGHCVDAPIVLD